MSIPFIWYLIVTCVTTGLVTGMLWKLAPVQKFLPTWLISTCCGFYGMDSVTIIYSVKIIRRISCTTFIDWWRIALTNLYIFFKWTIQSKCNWPVVDDFEDALTGLNVDCGGGRAFASVALEGDGCTHAATADSAMVTVILAPLPLPAPTEEEEEGGFLGSGLVTNSILLTFQNQGSMQKSAFSTNAQSRFA